MAENIDRMAASLLPVKFFFPFPVADGDLRRVPFRYRCMNGNKKPMEDRPGAGVF